LGVFIAGLFLVERRDRESASHLTGAEGGSPSAEFRYSPPK
jgi:hypothetical protein